MRSVRFDAGKIDEWKILLNDLHVLRNCRNDCRLELPSELESARAKDVDGVAVDKQVEVRIQLEDVVGNQSECIRYPADQAAFQDSFELCSPPQRREVTT